MAISQVGTATTALVTATTAAQITKTAVSTNNFLVLTVTANVVISSSVTDSTGNTWNLAKVQACSDAPQYTTSVYYCNLASSGDHTVTVPFGSSARCRLTIAEWAGMGSATLDKTNGNGPYTNSCALGTSGTLSAAEELVIIAAQLAASSGISFTSKPSGSSNLAEAVGGTDIFSADYIVTSAATAINPTYTTAGNAEWAAAYATFVPGDPGLILNAESGTYALTGQAANLSSPTRFTLSTEKGDYVITGQDAAVDIAFTAETGYYTLTGQAANLILSAPVQLSVTASAGAYTLTGQAANFIKNEKYALVADAGSYSLIGRNAILLNNSTPGPGGDGTVKPFSVGISFSLGR